MPEAFTLGPILISTRIAAFVVAYLAARWIAARLAARWGLDTAWVRGTADGALIAGLVAARLGYAALYWDAYASVPWSVLYFWQPGYLAVAGLAGGALYVLYRLWRSQAIPRLPALRAIGTGFAAGAVLVTAVAGSMGWFTGAGGSGVGDPAPDIRLMNLAGEPVALSDLAGRGVVLNFWATWCPPCRREMPLLEAAWQEHRPKGITIVGIDVGESPDTIKPFIGSMGVSYPIWVDAARGTEGVDDTNSLLARFGGVGLPTTVFIDAGGVIRHIYIGELSRGMLAEWLPKLAPD